MLKIGEDNNVIAHASMVYVKNDTELLWRIRSSIDCNENQIWQLCHWLCADYDKNHIGQLHD